METIFLSMNPVDNSAPRWLSSKFDSLSSLLEMQDVYKYSSESLRKPELMVTYFHSFYL
jgi:hypothetical protein